MATKEDQAAGGAIQPSQFEIREEMVKIVYRNAQPVGMFKKNGNVKFYMVAESDYSSIEDVFALGRMITPGTLKS